GAHTCFGALCQSVMSPTAHTVPHPPVAIKKRAIRPKRVGPVRLRHSARMAAEPVTIGGVAQPWTPKPARRGYDACNGIPLTDLRCVVWRRSNRQHRADRLDSVSLAMRVDERDHHAPRRSSSAWAK